MRVRVTLLVPPGHSFRNLITVSIPIRRARLCSDDESAPIAQSGPTSSIRSSFVPWCSPGAQKTADVSVAAISAAQGIAQSPAEMPSQLGDAPAKRQLHQTQPLSSTPTAPTPQAPATEVAPNSEQVGYKHFRNGMKS